MIIQILFLFFEIAHLFYFIFGQKITHLINKPLLQGVKNWLKGTKKWTSPIPVY